MVAVVTGAGSGIGLRCVEKLLLRDYIVVAWVKNKVDEELMLADLALKNIRVHRLYVVHADFIDLSSVTEATRETLELLGDLNSGLDAFINCAGVFSGKNFTPHAENEEQKIVNLQAPLVLLNSLSVELEKRTNSRAIFVVADKLKPKITPNKVNTFTRAYYFSKTELARALTSLAKKGTNYGILMVSPRPSTTDFYIKNTIGLRQKMGFVRKMFSLPPEYTAEQITILATRPEYANESGTLYRDLRPVALPADFFATHTLSQSTAESSQHELV